MVAGIYVLSAHIATLLARARDAGLDADALAAGAGLDVALLAEATAPVPLTVFEHICGACEQSTGDPLFAALASLFTSGQEYRMGYYAVTTLPDARASLRDGMKLFEHMANPLNARFEEIPGGGSVVLTPIAKPPPGTKAYAELLLGLVLAATRRCTSVMVVPEAVRSAHAPRTDEADYADAFGVPVTFGTQDYAVVFSDAVLNLPNRSPDEHLARLAAADVLREARGHHTSNLDAIALVQATLNAAGRSEDWRLESVADRYRVAPRTLQYRLRQSGTTFQVLADAARRSRAAQLLRGGLPLEEVSYRLGYADSSSFRKAFVRWYAATPGEWRRRVDALNAQLR